MISQIVGMRGWMRAAGSKGRVYYWYGINFSVGCTLFMHEVFENISDCGLFME